MNKRIQELAEDAAGTRKHVPPVWQFYDEELKKFAEMLIQEVCFDMMNVHLDKNKISLVAKSWGVEVL